MAWYIQNILACLVCTTILLLSSSPMVDSFLLDEEESTKYVAQVKVFLDYSGREKWKVATGKATNSQLQADIQTVFDQMNTIFRRLKGVNLQLELKDIATVKYYDQVIKGVRNFKVNGAKAVFDFQEWIEHRYYKQEFDLALLFTGNDMYVGGSYSPYGVAVDIGVACSSRGVGIVEMFGKLPTDRELSNMARYTAHEIGHILGANHNDDESECRHQKGYLMAANAHTTGPNIFNITDCTSKSIAAFIKNMKQGENCLLPDYTELPEADKVCQDRGGSDKWYMSRNYKKYGDEMCMNLKCISWNGSKRVFTKAQAPDGLGCGKNKRCKNGKCIDAQDGDPNMSDECPWGNQNLKKLVYTKSCEAQDCRYWGTYCCAHCKALDKELERIQG